MKKRRPNKDATGAELKEFGLGLAAQSRAKALAHAQEIARDFGKGHGTVTIDAVIQQMELEGTPASALGCAAGAVFVGFEPTGEFVKSIRPSRRCGMVRVWRMKAKS